MSKAATTGELRHSVFSYGYASHPQNTLIRSMVLWTPELVFLIFGRKSMLSSVYFWQSVLSPRAMAWLMDMTMRLLFGWSNENIRPQRQIHPLSPSLFYGFS